VVDEAHRGMGTARTTRDTIVSQIIGGGTTDRPAAPVVWGISATPKRFRDQMSDRSRAVKPHTVPIEDVRASGLLKDQIVLGHTKGVDAAETTLVRHAITKIREYETRWNAYCHENGDPRVDPILVVQVDDKPTSKDLGDLIGTVLEEWPDVTAANVVHTFASHATEKAGAHGIRYCPPEDIQDRHDVRVVLCKTAITTGWDCPRAEVLVSMRVANDADLVTQIMGRMVRTPLARRILTDQNLNTVHCVLPKFNEQAVDDIAKQFEAGDDGLAAGAEIITNPVEIGHNPAFAPQVPAPAQPVPPAGAPQDGQPANGEQTSGGTEDTSWFGPDQPIQPASPSVSSSGRGVSRPNPVQDGPTLEEAANAPQQDVEATGGHDIFTVIQALPTYTIPRRTRRPGVSRLLTLATLLAERHDGKAIEAAAQAMARNALLAEIDTYRANLEAKDELDHRLEQVTTTRLYERAVMYGSPTEDMQVSETNIDLDARGIGILFDRARRALREGLAEAHVQKSAPDDDDVTDAQILTNPEIASALGLTRNTVKTYLKRARRAFRLRLHHPRRRPGHGRQDSGGTAVGGVQGHAGRARRGDARRETAGTRAAPAAAPRPAAAVLHRQHRHHGLGRRGNRLRDRPHPAPDHHREPHRPDRRRAADRRD